MTRVQRASAVGAVLVLFLPAMTWGQALSEEWGFDLPGNDYSSFDARRPADCKRACRSDARCEAYTFNTRSQTCYLKDRIGPRQANAYTVSGIKQGGEDYVRLLGEEWGYDRPGNDYSSFDARRPADCKRACRSDARCEAYTFNTRSQTCYLKDRVGPRQRTAYTVTGVKQEAETYFQELSEEQGYDHPGNDYSSFDAPDLADCQRACRMDLRCEAYTFNTRSRTCYLKDRVGSKQRRYDTVTGTKQDAAHSPRELSEEWGYDYPGYDYSSFRVGRLADCVRACQNDRACQAYTFNTRTQTCYLKNQAGSKQRRSDTISGAKRESASPPEVLSEEPGYDHPGNDYVSFRARGVADCKRACQVEARCQAYTFNNRSQSCYLKDRIGSKQRRGDTITGTKQETGLSQEELSEEWGYDYPGNDYSSFRVGRHADCVRACERDQRCRAYSLSTSSLTCYLKDQAGHKQSRPDIVSGVKRGY